MNKKTKDKISTLELDDIEYFLTTLTPQTYPKRHNTHKYWGKKPANVFKALIEKFSAHGETVLDPFSGSGVTIVEAMLTGRKGIGVDLNPFSKVLGDAICHSALSVKDFKNKAKQICASLEDLESELYSTNCRKCDSLVLPTSFSWEKKSFVGLKYRCTVCKESSFVEPNSNDKKKAGFKKKSDLLFPDTEIINGWETQKLLKAGMKNFSELFTDRNLTLCAALISLINEFPDKNTRELLKITFTSNLAQCTRMIVDYKNTVNGGGPSWKINCYWLPSDWQELNPLHYFRNRINKTSSAIEEMQGFSCKKKSNSKFITGDSRLISSFLDENSIDYILTDPPYGGEGIQYGELSILWNTWLGLEQDLTREIAENPYRKQSNEDYGDGLLQVFDECYKVLKPGRWMSLTFNNKNTKIWNSLLSACCKAGFKIKAVSMIKRSAPSLTEHTMNDAPKSDLLIQFQKEQKRKRNIEKTKPGSFNLCENAIKIARNLKSENKEVTTESVLNILTIEWLTNYYTSADYHFDSFGEISISFINKCLTTSEFSKGDKVSDDKKFDNFIWKI